MLRFEQLPDELIELIVDAADLRAKKRFSLVNHRMRRIAVSFTHGCQKATAPVAEIRPRRCRFSSTLSISAGEILSICTVSSR